MAALNQMEASPDVAVINQRSDGRRAVSLAMRNTIQGNEKGQFSFQATNYDRNGKMSHFITLNAEPAKSGEHKGQSQAMRFAKAGGFEDIMKNALDKFDKQHTREEGKVHERVPELEDVAVKMNTFNKKDVAPNAVFYTKADHSILRKEDDPKEARSAQLARIEETIKPSPDFDPAKEKQLVKEHRAVAKEAKAKAKEAKDTSKAPKEAPQTEAAGPEA